eukprot:3456306-Amphidinium_carterae.1
MCEDAAHPPTSLNFGCLTESQECHCFIQRHRREPGGVSALLHASPPTYQSLMTIPAVARLHPVRPAIPILCRAYAEVPALTHLAQLP